MNLFSVQSLTETPELYASLRSSPRQQVAPKALDETVESRVHFKKQNHLIELVDFVEIPLPEL